ncbi:chromosome transmission fidelity protein 18 homolog isoform X1 [Nothobranchius furzeri]|uniref:Chromosome transmission fidelity protein 18 homolog n=2 Tax=Nothobranchius TaxID=28779 RepID=A0A1A8UW16_NOTFU|nr:chromosome transmission fidelity protein 18 homolog isoform X1 [Nothobranchius furzeri]KAF7223516.1 transcript variant X1 [Nothobranchius furzeri]
MSTVKFNMDEYDEMFEIEDHFEEQFADELEVLAEMEEKTCKPAKRQKQSTGDDISDIEHLLDDKPITPKSTRQKKEMGVVKRLFNAAESQERKVPSQHDDITPPSSPEHYEPSDAVRSTPVVLDISGFAEIPETPGRHPITGSPSSLHVLKRPPLEGDYISVTDSSGNRVYLRQKEDTDTKITESRLIPNSYGALGLLAVPIGVLRTQEAERRHQQVVEESQRLTELLDSSVNGVSAEFENAEDENADPEDAEGRASRLWVDRFSPRHYTELLSDDFTNRCLLKWLKLWDTVVFGRERKSRPAFSDRQTGGQKSFKPNQGNQNPNRFKSKIEMTEELLEAELDQYKRPKFKVALLSGPPGLGKTTLAHVIAKHAGYNVVEINASDDRSAEVFQKRIDTATQMKSVLGASERPNCLIIDEIDGAPAAAINILLAVLNRKDGPAGEAGAEAAKKKKKKESMLLRPIICICNDLYAPALRPLRQQAFLLAFPQTQPSRLTQRLAEISVQQGLKADSAALMSLCEKTDNDIRSCINTLQFLHSRGLKQLDARTIQSVSVGQKDQNKGLFHLWQEIFQLPRTKRKRVGEGFDEAPGSGSGAQRFQNVLHLASSSGEYEKVSQGLYDNYLSMRVRDPNLQGTCEALDWLTFSDRLNQVILHGQNFSLMKYLPFLSVAFHFLFAHTNVPRISYPHSHHEASSRLLGCRNALSAMLADIPASVRARVSQLSLSLDVLSLLLDIICPKLRPVNPQLFSSREKEQMHELIDTMLAYNLSYRQDRTPEGQYIYVLEPRVEEVARFPGLPPRRQLTYQAKQTISREMEQEKMRRAEQTMLQRNPAAAAKEEEKKSAGPKPTRNHQQRLENIVKQTIVEMRPEVDFFGRAVAPRPQRAEPSSDTGEKCAVLAMGTAVGNSDVWFRFNEGMSNAVRRNVYIRELL